MATLTLKYNACNQKAKNLLNYVLSTGLFVPCIDKKASLAKAFEDLEKGHIHSVRKVKA